MMLFLGIYASLSLVSAAPSHPYGAADGPRSAYRLRVDGANTHRESASTGTKFAIAADATPTFTWAATHGEHGRALYLSSCTLMFAARAYQGLAGPGRRRSKSRWWMQ